MARDYRIWKSMVNPTAVTQIQIQAPTARSITIIRAWVSQASTTTSAQVKVQILRMSAGATVTAATIAADVRPMDPDDAASTVQVGTAATGFTATVAGTESDIMMSDNFNVVNGWLYLPVPEERIITSGGGRIALKFATAPPAGTYDVGIVFAEGAGS